MANSRRVQAIRSSKSATPAARLARDIGAGEGLAGAKPGGLGLRQLGRADQRSRSNSQPIGESRDAARHSRARLGSCLGLTLQGSPLAVTRPAPSSPAILAATLGGGSEEGREIGDDLAPGRRAPCAIGGDQSLEQVASRISSSPKRAADVGLGIAASMPISASSARFDRRGIAERFHRLMRPGAGHQIALGAALAEPQAERRDIVDKRRVAARLGVGEQRRPASAAPALLPRGPRSAGSRARCPLPPGRRPAASGRSCGWSGCAGRRRAHRAPRANRRRARSSSRRSAVLAEREQLLAQRPHRAAAPNAASRSPMRLAISAAPALVKVRQRID